MAIALAMTFFAFVACDNVNGSNGNGTSTGTGNDSNNQGGQELPQLNPVQNPQVIGTTINFRADSGAERFRLGFMNYVERTNDVKEWDKSLDELLEAEFFYTYLTPYEVIGTLIFVDFSHLFESGDLPLNTRLDVSITSIGREGVHRNSQPMVAGPAGSWIW
ncbi:MAG: hypothetical protein FWC80_05865 [Firmicutes bacterium]|nr:hypothetical protein [Bacillota bacterium]